MDDAINAALERKERLKKLRERAELIKKNNSDSDESSETEEKLPGPIFRSYAPQSESLTENQLPRGKPSDVDELISDQVAAAKTEIILDHLDITKLAPRKPDWDLKRDIGSKLEKLDRRTQRAIAELIRERLLGNKDELFKAASFMKAVDMDQ